MEFYLSEHCSLPLKYRLCPHREQYAFKRQSELKNYLINQCPGFLQSENDTYSLNYIILLLLINWIQTEELKYNLINLSGEFRNVLKTDCQFLHVSYLRKSILRQMVVSKFEERVLNFNNRWYRSPLWCLNGSRDVIEDILQSSDDYIYPRLKHLNIRVCAE